MRSILLSITLVTLIGTLNAQAPLGFSFQTIIRDSEGKVQKNQAVSLRFSILESSEAGTSIYSESHSKTTNEFGVVNLTIGTGTPLSGSFSSIVWGSNIHFLKTEIDPTGGTTYSILTTSQLMSVPYAMYAAQADTVLKTNVTDNANNGDILYYSDNEWKQLPKGNEGDFLKINELGEPVWQSFTGFVSDIDGNSYPSVKIGEQIWFTENLKTTSYNDGSTIPNITDYTIWKNDTEGGYSYFNNDSAAYSNTYGALYNWYAVNTGKLCPIGWHVPTTEEWTILTDFLGGAEVAGNKLKEKGTQHWNNDSGATNKVGFNALPGGSRDSNGSFYNIRNIGFWWTSSINDANAWNRDIYDNLSLVNSGSNFKKNGFSIRCIKN